MTALLRRAERVHDALAVVLFALMLAVVLLQIVLRYVFNAPLVWSDEAAQYLFVWVSFMGWTMASRRRIHIGIGVVIDRLPAPLRRALHALWCVLQVAFALILLVVGVMITRAQADVKMVSIDFAFWPVYVVVPLAAVFLVAYALRDLVVIVTRGDVKATEAQL
jgi:TRAP-type C4-dicarboxylate transport system permease small subunit